MVGGDVKYKEPPLLLRNNGQAVFEDMQAEAGSAFKKGYNGRGLAVGVRLPPAAGRRYSASATGVPHCLAA